MWLYPAKDLLFYSADIHGNLMARQRIAVLRRLMEDREGVVVTTMDGLMDHLLPLKYLREHPSRWRADRCSCIWDVWKERLIASGL